MTISVLILRDSRECAKKCSLMPLRGKPSIEFVRYDAARRVSVGARILLHPEGTLLTRADLGQDLLVIDCAWRRVDALLATVDGELSLRRLPVLRTAYPRTSRTHADPQAGLASVEALYAALCILGEPRDDLLEQYHWRDEFLHFNPGLC